MVKSNYNFEKIDVVNLENEVIVFGIFQGQLYERLWKKFI
jgi:hypothetical protein